MAENARGRRAYRWLLVVAVVALIAYTLILRAVVLASDEDQRARADAIVVLGAAQYNGKPSPVLRARLDHAVALFHDGLAPSIIVLGGRAEGDRESEARVGQRYLLETGVPDSSDIAISEG
ncbi:MAG TPA: YdcF family protein, partial [Gemmatimonadales bacterium]|nr:YdcF family protein [Gemmatimonadales bacterium]